MGVCPRTWSAVPQSLSRQNMNQQIGLVCALVAFSGQVFGQANPPLKFDMGTGASPTASGWIPVDDTTTHPANDASTPVTFGWTPASSVTSADRTAIRPEIVHNHPPQLLQDFNHGVGAITFQADLTPGTYQCMVYLGDVDNRVDDLRVTAEGIVMADGAFARTVNAKATLDGALGGYKRLGFIVPVDADGLQIEFEGMADGIPVMGIEIYDYALAPLGFNHSTSTVTKRVTLADDTDLNAGLAALNNADYDLAVAHFMDIGLPTPNADDLLAKAYGLAFVVGSLTPHVEQVDTVVLTEIVDTLALLDQNNSAVRSLFVEALDLQDGDLFNRTRAYSLSAFPENPESLLPIGGGATPGIVLNLCAAVQFLEQMEDDILDAADFRWNTESPFFPTAQYLIARNFYGRNTHLGIGTNINNGQDCNPNFVELNDYWVRIFTDRLWPRLDATGPQFLYPKADEAMTVCWFFDTYVDIADNMGPQSGPCPRLLIGMINMWDGVSTPPGVDPAQTWWNSYSVIDDTSGAPLWASQQRAYARQFRNLARWWIEYRLRGIELGGGSGDDQEAVTLSVPSITRGESPDNPNVEAPLNGIWDSNLFRDSNVNVGEGYFNNAGDIEHAAEYTTNPLFALLPTNYGDPRYYEFAMRTMRNFEDEHEAPTSPNAWLAPTFRADSGDTASHFRAHHFGGDAQPVGNRDIPMNMKAVPPGMALMDFNDSPTAQRLFEQWVWAWRDAAMSTDGGKPAGYHPAAVTVDAQGQPGAFGTGGLWYRNGTYSGFPSAYTLDHYYLAVQIARRSSSPDAAQLVDPMITAVNSVIAWGGGDPTAPDGSEEWAAGKARTAIATAAWLAKSELIASPAVDNADLNQLINDYAASMQRFLNENEALVPTDKSEFEPLFGKAQLWMRHFWPFTTTTVAYTDRFKFSIPAYQSLYTTASAATFSLSPTFPVTWFNPASNGETTSEEELDLAILVNRFRPTGGGLLGRLEVLVHNFDDEPRQLGLRIWRGLGAGDYMLSVGPDADGNDRFDRPPLRRRITLNRRGADVLLPVRPGMSLIRLRQITAVASAPPEFDLGLASEEVSIDASDDTLHLRVHNLGLTRFDPAGTHAARLEVLRNGTELYSIPISTAIDSPEDSPSGLDPVSIPLSTPGAVTGDPQDKILVRIRVSAGEQITIQNDALTFALGDIPRN